MIIPIIISILLIIIAGISNAIMDTVAYQVKWEQSKFSLIKKESINKWFRYDSWKLKYVNYDNGDLRQKKFVWFRDSWHFFKSLMIICLVGFGLIFSLSGFSKLWIIFVAWLGAGIIYILIFNLFYNKIWKK